MTTKAHGFRYRNKDNKIVPGVTTILNLLNKPALMHWAWNLGIQGIDYRKVTDKAANIGTITHYLVECFLKGTAPDLGEYSPNAVAAARTAYANFEDWWMLQDLKVVASEVSLVSEKMQVGGALDCVARQERLSELWLVDIKTSKGVYDEMLYQLSAYWNMWDENHPDDPIEVAKICQLSKEDGRLSIHTYRDLRNELEVFMHLRAVYELRKTGDRKRNKDRALRRGEGQP